MLSIQTHNVSRSVVSKESRSKRQKIRLLIADDHTIVRKGFIRLLSLEDAFEIVGEASDGNEAVNLVKDLNPDVVLMDIGMPVLNGLESTRRIKNSAPQVKILILSAYDNDHYIYQVIRAGAHGYLMKNIEAKELFTAIKSVRNDKFVFPESVQLKFKDELLSLKNGKNNSLPDDHNSLTDREREILQLIAEGKSHQQISEMLCISVRTVDTHRNNIIKKLDVHDTANLVLYAIKSGVVFLPR